MGLHLPSLDADRSPSPAEDGTFSASRSSARVTFGERHLQPARPRYVGRMGGVGHGALVGYGSAPSHPHREVGEGGMWLLDLSQLLNSMVPFCAW